ncbi:hypothetical protein Zmor_027268 [Zophobas morio]|uniref:Sulfotransferase domain-containing protein n=1 Tax=Zophobas morio TaxID=2755281 RepID=A0AA38HTC1_9CUCU|nr:hypothetical protein Zmor_027268 [Zophobas morio]
MDFDKLIKEKWTSLTRKGYAMFENCMMPQKYAELKNEFDKLKVNEEDIWVCTFPKCGTTWTQEMVWLIANNLDFETAKKVNLDQRFPFLEMSTIVDFSDEKSNLPNFQVPDCVVDSLGVIKNLKSPAFIKTHLPIQLFPQEIRNGTKKPKIIYVARDPRDVCVSFYHHSTIIDYFEINFEEYCELFLAGKVLYGSFWDHILPFWEMRHQPNILFIKYEDMKKDLKKVIKQVAEFLGRTFSEQDLERLAKHLSFDSMKNNPAVNKEILVELVKKFYDKKNDGSFLRKGIVGDHKAAMSPEMLRKFDNWIKDNIQGTDYVV